MLQTNSTFFPARLAGASPLLEPGSFSSGLRALGHQEESFAPAATQEKQNPSYSSRAVEWGSEGTRDWWLQEGQRRQAEGCCAPHCLSSTALGSSRVPGEGAALPPLSGGQSLTCCVPRDGWDRADLEPFALSRPGEHENIPGSQLEGGLGLGQQVPVQDGLSGSWVSFAHKPWLSMRVPGQGAGLVGAREGSCNP